MLKRNNFLFLNGVLITCVLLTACGGNSSSNIESIKDSHLRLTFKAGYEKAKKFYSEIDSGEDCTKFYGALTKHNRQNYADILVLGKKLFPLGFSESRHSISDIENPKIKVNKSQDGTKDGLVYEKKLDKLAGSLLFKKDYLACGKKFGMNFGNGYVSLANSRKFELMINANNTSKLEGLIKAHLAIGKIYDVKFGNSTKAEEHFDRANYYLSNEFIAGLPEGTVDIDDLGKYGDYFQLKQSL